MQDIPHSRSLLRNTDTSYTHPQTTYDQNTKRSPLPPAANRCVGRKTLQLNHVAHITQRTRLDQTRLVGKVRPLPLSCHMDDKVSCKRQKVFNARPEVRHWVDVAAHLDAYLLLSFTWQRHKYVAVELLRQQLCTWMGRGGSGKGRVGENSMEKQLFRMRGEVRWGGAQLPRHLSALGPG